MPHPARNNAQTTIGTPEVVEITIKVGVVQSSNHGQWQYEAHDASGRVLLEMGSKHHFHLGDHDEEATTIGELVKDLLYSYCGPFGSF